MQHAFLTVDLGFGDAGKGSVVDFLTRAHDAHTVVRYNGGAQAAHRVVTAGPKGREHVFAQFGSGTLAGAATHLSRFMLIDPLAMVAEEQHLQAIGVSDAFERTTIDERALVITPFQRAANRLKELARGDGRHGSCGMGIGETMVDYLEHGQRVLFMGDLRNPDLLRAKLHFLREVNLAKVQALLRRLPDSPDAAREQEPLIDHSWCDWLSDAYGDFARQARIVPGTFLHTIMRRPGAVVFEGAQGVLLDEWHGFHPHTTWSTTTLENADQLLKEAGYTGNVTRIGITRAYSTRHGAGPLVTEDADLTRALPDPSNGYGAWQRSFRVGWLDLVTLRYALEVVGTLDQLAVTCLDRLVELPEPRVCRRYRYDTFDVERIVRSPAPHDLEYQERITQGLARCQPVLEAIPDQAALLELLATDLAVPVGLLSQGPTAEDKYLLETTTKNEEVSPQARMLAPTPSPASKTIGVSPFPTKCAAAASPTGSAPITATGK
ncbi:MAG TPA: adenylosuccinate synthetase [Roseiflexaceae bacterium]|nr:adenylosuccinate synthetase [Roseiflexaceae bacterium]